MATALDSSVLIEWQRAGQKPAPLRGLPGLYIPAHAASEFLVGVHLVEDRRFARDLQRFYDLNFQRLVRGFADSEAARLAKLIATLAKKGQQLKFFDAAIAASAMAGGDTLATIDNDFDRLSGSLKLLKL